MGDQGGAAASPHAVGLPDIAAERAMTWNVELERGLRAPKPGAQFEAILKSGPRMLWWSEEPIASAPIAALYKLDAGQDKMFTNAMVQRLAEAFRTGTNANRVCILKVFLLVSKGSKHSKNPAGTGLLRKERIANYPEVLRRVKAVMDSGDVIARALALRMIGCLGEIAADSVDVHRHVIEALESPHQKEVEAALNAMGRLCELSPEFAQVAFDKLVFMVNAMETLPVIKLCAIRVFPKLAQSPYLSLQAHEAGKALMLCLPTTEIVSTMLTSLTRLALKSIVTTEKQVELLMAYISSDPRATVRAVALECLSRLALQAARSAVFSEKDFAVLSSVIEDIAAAPAVLALAYQVIKKLSNHYIMMMNKSDLHRLMSTIELSVLHHPWPVVEAAVECAVTFGCNLTRLELEEEMETHNRSVSNVHFGTRVGLLLCDLLAIEGSHAKKLRKDCTTDQQVKEEFNPERLCVLQGLVVQLAHCPHVGPLVIDSLALMIKVFTKEHLKDDLQSKDEQMPVAETSHMEIDSTEVMKTEVTTQCHSDESDDALEKRLEYVLTLCHCMSLCVDDVESKTAHIVFPKLLDLATEISAVDPFCQILRVTIPSLLRIWRVKQIRTIEEKRITESLLIKCFGQMKNSGEFWSLYKVGLEAAVNGLWAPLSTVFEELTKKVQSEGCYLWLLSLSHLAKAEAFLGDIVIYKCTDQNIYSEFRTGTTEVGGKSHTSLQESGPTFMDVNETSQGVQLEKKVDHDGEIVSHIFGEAAARAIPLLLQAGASLASGVWSDRTFEFQQWFVSIRLRMLQYVAQLSQILMSSCTLEPSASPSTLDINIQSSASDIWSSEVPAAIDDEYERQSISSFKSGREKTSSLCTHLIQLSKELDLLSISFAGLPRQSFQPLCEAAVGCSLLAFCTEALLLGSSHSDQLATQNLDCRLRNVMRFDMELPYRESMGFGLDYASPSDSLAKLCDWAIKNVHRLERDATGTEEHSSTNKIHGNIVTFLQLLISKWSQLPFSPPRFFFCTRPRTGVDLFVGQSGGEERNELSVTQGAALLLSLHAQITNSNLETPATFKTLFCVLSCHCVENTALVEEDLYMGWKVGWHEGQASNQNSCTLNFPLLEKLVQRARCKNAQEAVELEHDLVSSQAPRQEQYREIEGFCKGGGVSRRCFVSIAVDMKGQGFESCLLDVTTLSCGQYQLSFNCVGLDTRNRPWVLLASNIHSCLKIIPPG